MMHQDIGQRLYPMCGKDGARVRDDRIRGLPLEELLSRWCGVEWDDGFHICHRPKGHELPHLCGSAADRCEPWYGP